MPDDSIRTEKCFLLNWICGDNRGRFGITLYAVNVERKPVKITVDDFRPLFFVPQSVPRRSTLGAAERRELPMRAMKDGSPVDCCYFDTYAASCEVRSSLREKGFTVYESDVLPAERYLMERFVRGGFTAYGRWETEGPFFSCRSPRIYGVETVTDLSVLSFDVETDVRTGEVLSIACCGKSDTVFVRGSGGGVTSQPLFCGSEKELLERFFGHLTLEDPDVLIGWNVAEFDLKVIQNRCRALRVPFRVGREPGGTIAESSATGRVNARIPGRAVIDVPSVLRSFFRPFEEYSLDFVAGEFLGRHKLIRKTGNEKTGEILRLFREDPVSLAAYNLEDAKLTKDIFERADLLRSAVERSRRSGLLLGRTGGSVASFDYLYLPRLHRAGYVASDAADAGPSAGPLPGGYVLEPRAGYYENVLSFDFRSLYPSIIMTFKIDPLGLVTPSPKRVKGPAGPSFSAELSILPDIIRELMEARDAAKREHNVHLSQAIKILMNSFYGVLGAAGCRFFSAQLASAITQTGRYIFQETMEYIQKSTGLQVIYGDTDSLFVHAGAAGSGRRGPEIAGDATGWLAAMLKERFGVVSALELRYECCYRHFLLPSLRSASQGSKKHYCGAVETPSGLELVFKGMESARSDWTDLAKEFQRELFLRLFEKRPVEEYVLSVVKEVMAGRADEKLVYRKRLRKKLEEYTGPLPPHVQAARQLSSPGGMIKYYMTTVGPQPAENRAAPIDYVHYIDCQLRPVADSVLEWFGTGFDRIVSGQQELFSNK